MRNLAALCLLLLVTATTATADETKVGVVECPQPAGRMIEGLRRTADFINDNNPHYVPPGGKQPKDGWYATLPDTLTAKYTLRLPQALDLYDTPLFIGTLVGGQVYGDRIDLPMICGHTMETNQWKALIEAVGVGYASLDVRQLLKGERLPEAAGTYTLHQPLTWRFTIGDIRYQLVPIGIDVGLVKVWRPDLVAAKQGIGDDLPPKQPYVGDPSVIWPMLNGFRALLFADQVPWTEQPKDSARGGTSPVAGFEYLEHKQFPDVFDTPLYVGRVRARGEPDGGFTVKLDREGLVVTRSGGGTARIGLVAWATAQDESSYGGITQPELDFELDGTRYKLIVDEFFTMDRPDTEGPKNFENAFVSGELFSTLPSGTPRPPRRPDPEPQVVF